MNFVLESDSRIDGISNHKTKQVYDTIIFFLKALDGYLSGTLMKRFHWTDGISEKMSQYQNKCM